MQLSQLKSYTKISGIFDGKTEILRVVFDNVTSDKIHKLEW